MKNDRRVSRMKKDKKELFYGQYWPYGVGCDDFTAYAFESEKAREKWLSQYAYEEEKGNPMACTATYEEMQHAYGNNFCVLADGSVCSRLEAVELNRLDGVEYF